MQYLLLRAAVTERLYLQAPHHAGRFGEQSRVRHSPGPQRFHLDASTALQRYDGANFITIADYNRVPGSIYYEDICLMEDRKGRIWAGTPDNIRMYDPVTARESVMPVQVGLDVSQQGLSCYNLLEDHHGEIWATTRAGLLQYDPSKKAFLRPAAIPDSICRQMNSGIGEDVHGNLWISGTRNLYMFSKDRKTLYGQYNNTGQVAALNIPASAKDFFRPPRQAVDSGQE
ncbi:hypothetical protein MKQ70_31885 [Chitinophaga sedimenti]|uniref:two-component regulator propeller domain-containing protein n=1 Tax=Chitinophaga sedimenti TaxID=2033606 RepID=UPI002002F9FB|nr:two-component regulator propeller domain-containing protein [Chitinophaga sedimenti]MCK7559320.1 hypothetical protein [Chitinophaga sedimenti]